MSGTDTAQAPAEVDDGERMYAHAELAGRAGRVADTDSQTADATGGAFSVGAPPAAAPTPVPVEAAIADLVDRPLSPGERWAEHATTQDPARQLGSAFDPLEAQARNDGNAEDVAALSEGRQLAGELLAEYGAKPDEAREIVSGLSRHHEAYMRSGRIDDDALDRTNLDCLNTLRQAWGQDFDARLALAQRTAAQAMQRAPWLRELIEGSAAGSDPAIVKRFAELGLRQARRARRPG